MADLISRANIKAQLEPGINSIFGTEYNDLPNQWKQVFDVRTSNRAWEEDLKVTGFGLAARKPEGDVYTYDVMNEAWKKFYKPDVWGLAFRITQEAIEDNLYEDVAARGARMLVRSIGQTKEVNCWSVLNNAFNSAYKGGDGKELLATDHPYSTGGTFSNEPTTPVDLSEAALEAAITAIGDQTDDRGLKIQVMPKKLVVPTALSWTAEKLLSSKAILQPGTANNTINALVTMNALPGGVMVSNWLTDPDAWFILTDVPNGLTVIQRRGIKKGMEGNFEDDTLKYKASERYAYGWTDPLAVYGSPGA